MGRTPDPIWDDNDCLVWQGATNTSKSNGHGVRNKNGKKVYVHRWAWEDIYGPIPNGLVVNHTCYSPGRGNPRCMNVNHMELVTQSDNAKLYNHSLNKAKPTHCPHGHSFNKTNTYVRPSDGSYICRACRRLSKRKRRKERT